MLSCNESNIGIFYGLEHEEKLKDNSLPNGVTVGSMVKLVNNNKLYIAAGNVYTKTSQTEEDWVKIESPPGFDLSTSLATDGTDIYAIYYTKNSANKGFFSLNGSIWQEINISLIEGSIEFVKSVNNEILVSTRATVNDANLYSYSGGFNGVFTKINIPMIGSPFYAVYDGARYWVSNHNRLYRGNSLASLTPTAQPALGTDYEIRGLEVLDSSYIYYTYWEQDVEGHIGVTNGDSYNYKRDKSFMLNGLKLFTVSGYKFLLCGTGGRGYYQTLNPSTGNIDLEKPRNNVLAENYNSAVDLQDAAVLDFFIDGGDDGDLYALTATRGLWKNSLSGNSRTWSIE